MLINNRCYLLWQKASRAPAKPFSLQLLLSSQVIASAALERLILRALRSHPSPLSAFMYSVLHILFVCLLVVVAKAKQLMCSASITLSSILKALEETSKPEPPVLQASE